MSLIRRACRSFGLLPRRAIEDFWKGSYMDPALTGDEKMRNAASGDPWPAVLLRLKSFEDLHKLWYVLLKEKNLLMGERLEARQAGVRWKNYGRLKKTKLSMKRILTVLSRREIHQHCLRGKEMLEKQEQRESIESQRFHLEESMKSLSYKIGRLGPRDSLQSAAWKATLQKYETDHANIMRELVPLRKDTMQLLVTDWRYQRKYSDLPGAFPWRKQWVRALQDHIPKPVKNY